MKKGSFTFRARLRSFNSAIMGLYVLFEQINARIQFFAAILVVVMSWILEVSMREFCLLLLCIGIVLAMEAINTAIEYLADFVCPQIDERIRRIKDVSAAAVLIAAGISLIIGLIIFLPKIQLQIT